MYEINQSDEGFYNLLASPKRKGAVGEMNKTDRERMEHIRSESNGDGEHIPVTNGELWWSCQIDFLLSIIDKQGKELEKGEDLDSLCSLDCDTCADTIQSYKELEGEE
jgi:hypothetical protein